MTCHWMACRLLTLERNHTWTLRQTLRQVIRFHKVAQHLGQVQRDLSVDWRGELLQLHLLLLSANMSALEEAAVLRPTLHFPGVQ
jgi:hypothetical protein